MEECVNVKYGTTVNGCLEMQGSTELLLKTGLQAICLHELYLMMMMV